MLGFFHGTPLFDKYPNKMIKDEASAVSDDYKRSGEIKAIRNTPIIDRQFRFRKHRDSGRIT